MQPGTCDIDDRTKEQYEVTFQIALIGQDGLVVASDRLGVHATPSETGGPIFSQASSQIKYCISDDQSVFCFWAGGAMSPVVARQIALSCKPQHSELQWFNLIQTVAQGIPLPYQHPVDQIIVVRADTPNAVFIVTRRMDTVSSMKMRDTICTGVSTVAQFFPRHLWHSGMPISELKTLALLTLSYATEENPSSVGPPFDIMTLDHAGRVTWSVHDPIHQTFQVDLERLVLKHQIA
jgi:hypothetical protein